MVTISVFMVKVSDMFMTMVKVSYCICLRRTLRIGAMFLKMVMDSVVVTDMVKISQMSTNMVMLRVMVKSWLRLEIKVWNFLLSTVASNVSYIAHIYSTNEP